VLKQKLPMCLKITTYKPRLPPSDVAYPPKKPKNHQPSLFQERGKNINSFIFYINTETTPYDITYISSYYVDGKCRQGMGKEKSVSACNLPCIGKIHEVGCLFIDSVWNSSLFHMDSSLCIKSIVSRTYLSPRQH